MQKVSNNHLTISNESKALYNNNSDKNLDELTSTINKDNIVSVANITTNISKSEITTVSNKEPNGFVIGDGSTNLTKEQKEKTKEADEKYAHDQLISKYMAKVEKDRPLVKGAKIKKYTNIDYKNYVKGTKLYEYYKVYWTKTSKVSYVGIPVRTAKSADKALYSKSGNYVDSRAKLTATQKKIISTFKKSKYKSKYRYVAFYRDETATKVTDLYIIPNSGRSAFYELSKRTNFTYNSKGGFTIPNKPSKNTIKHNVNIGYALYIIPHVATANEWYKQFIGFRNSKKLFHNYYINDYSAFKKSK